MTHTKHAIDDTDRLEFLLKHFHIENVGDEYCIPGIAISSECLEMVLSVETKSFSSDLRDVIDNAITHIEVI